MAQVGTRVKKKGTSSTSVSATSIASSRLLVATLAPSTVKKYDFNTEQFLQWMVDNGHHPTTVPHLDSLLAQYLDYIYERGFGLGAANSTVFGLELLYPGVCDQLPMSKKMLKGFKKLKPSTSHPPLTWPVTCVIALDMIKKGHFLAGVATLLAFDSYLRISEFTNLYREDIALGSDVRIGAGRPDRMYLRLRKTKTGPEQGVEVLNPDVKALLSIVIKRVPVGGKVFPYEDAQYRVLFHRVCDDLKLPRDYVPHSLRHGGATYGYLTDMSFVDIQVRGRWSSLKSCLCYVQTCRQALISRSFPPSIIAACNIVSNRPLLSLISEVLHGME